MSGAFCIESEDKLGRINEIFPTKRRNIVNEPSKSGFEKVTVLDESSKNVSPTHSRESLRFGH